MLKLQHKTWLDKAGVARAVTEGLKGKGMPSPLFRAAVDVQVTAQRSMKGGRRQHWWKAWTKWTRRRVGRVRQSKRGAHTRSEPSRKGTPPNVDTGGLKGSIRAALDEMKPSGVAGPTVLFGRIQEYGGHIMVTPKMRGFLAWAFGWHLKRSTQFIHLPARPYMRPALDAARPRFRDYFKNMPLGNTPSGQQLNSGKGGHAT